VKKRKARKYFASQLLNIDHHIVGRRPMLTAARSKLKTLKSHQGFRRYAANTSWMMGEKILRMFVGLFVGIWVARYLGPEQFGLLSYAQSFVFLFTAIATLGLDGIVVRELVKDESRRDELLGTAFGLKLIGAILILPSLWLAVQLTVTMRIPIFWCSSSLQRLSFRALTSSIFTISRRCNPNMWLGPTALRLGFPAPSKLH